MSTETEIESGPRQRSKRAAETRPEMVILIDEAIACLPATDAEIEVAKRYGGHVEFKSRMLTARQKMLAIRAKLIAA